MTDAELRKLKRSELLEILLEQAKEIERLEEENASLTRKLEDKRILIQNAGTMAEAAFALNGVFEAADAAVRQYLDNIYAMSPTQRSKESDPEEQDAADEQDVSAEQDAADEQDISTERDEADEQDVSAERDAADEQDVSTEQDA